MEPISAVTLSLALGAGVVAGKEVVSALVKDAYTALKDLIKNRYPNVSLEQLEQAPGSNNRRAVVEEDLTVSGAGQDTELLAVAHKLIELVQQQAPAVAPAIGIDLKDIAAANLRRADGRFRRWLNEWPQYEVDRLRVSRRWLPLRRLRRQLPIRSPPQGHSCA